MAARPKANDIQTKASALGISLSEAEAAQLEQGDNVPLKEQAIGTAAAAGCSGIKIADLGGGCGLYLIPFPPQISVCCTTP